MSQNEEQELAPFLEVEKEMREVYLKDMPSRNARIGRGWIDALGQFWGNDRGGHSFLITDCFGMSLTVIQKENWVIVWFEDQSWATDIGKAPNNLQKETLRKIGLDPENSYKPFDATKAVRFEELYPNGYEDHLYPPQMGQLDEIGAINRLAASKEEQARRGTEINLSPD